MELNSYASIIICYIDVYLLDNETTSNLLINTSHEIISFDLL